MAIPLKFPLRQNSQEISLGGLAWERQLEVEQPPIVPRSLASWASAFSPWLEAWAKGRSAGPSLKAP